MMAFNDNAEQKCGHTAINSGVRIGAQPIKQTNGSQVKYTFKVEIIEKVFYNV